MDGGKKMLFKKLNEEISDYRTKKSGEKNLKFLQKQETRILSILEEIEEVVNSGLSSDHTPESIANLHKVSEEDILRQIKIGEKIEMEHTDSPNIARKIAMDHLVELPDYYDRLAEMEKEGEAELDENINSFDFLNIDQENLEESNKEMTSFMKRHKYIDKKDPDGYLVKNPKNLI